MESKIAADQTVGSSFTDYYLQTGHGDGWRNEEPQRKASTPLSLTGTVLYPCAS